jgi:hypothetical protein
MFNDVMLAVILKGLQEVLFCHFTILHIGSGLGSLPLYSNLTGFGAR